VQNFSTNARAQFVFFQKRRENIFLSRKKCKSVAKQSFVDLKD